MQRHDFQNHPGHRKEEKLDMLNLNRRLETYLGRVRLLEEENELLRREIHALKGSSQDGKMGLDHQLGLTRQEVQNACREKDLVELELQSLDEEIQTLGLQRQWVADAHEVVMKKLTESRKQMEEEKRAQVWLKGKVSQLEEQVQFQIQTHQADVANLTDALITPPLPPRPTRSSIQLPDLHELGVEYSQVAAGAWQDAAGLYQDQVNSLEEALGQAKDHLVQVGQEKKESQLQLRALRSELASAQDRQQYLERSVSQTQDKQTREIQNMQAHLEVLEMEKEALGEQIDGLLIESRGLLQLKMSLGMEMAAYRALLDNENRMGHISSTNHLRRISISDGERRPQDVKPSLQTRMAISHRISSVPTNYGKNTKSNSKMSSSPIAPSYVSVNKTPERFEKTEEQPVDLNIEAKEQACWASPYPKVPENGIAVDHFRPQEVNEEVNYAEPLSPHTEDAGDDFVVMHGSSDLGNRSIWNIDDEKVDRDIVRTWPAEEKERVDFATSHRVESSFTVPSDAQKHCSPSANYENAQSTRSVSEARSDISRNDENIGAFEMSSENEEPLPDLSYSPINSLEEGDLETTREYAEYAENEGLESDIMNLEFESGLGKSLYSDSKEFKQENDISNKPTQPAQCLEEVFYHIRRLGEDVKCPAKDYDERDTSNKSEIQLDDKLQSDGYMNEEKLKRVEELNEENHMTEVVDGFSQLENISFQSAQTSSLSREIFPQVESGEESVLNLPIRDEINNRTNQSGEPDELSFSGKVTVGWEDVGGFSEENYMGERMDGCEEENDHLKEEEMLNPREPKSNQTEPIMASDGQKLNVDEEEHILSNGEHFYQSDRENVLSGGENVDLSEHEHIPSGGVKCNPIDDDEEHEDDTPSTSISGKAELIGNSYAQENTLADTRPLIRYKSDETDANTQASYLGESDASDGEEEKEVGQTGLCTLGEGKSRRFDTMEDLHEESEVHAMDQEGETGFAQIEEANDSQVMKSGVLGNLEEHASDLWNQEAEEEQFNQESTTIGENLKMYTDEDCSEERIDRLVEQELENLSISSYSEHFIGPMSASGSVLSLQAKEKSSKEAEQIAAENLNEPEHKPLWDEKPHQPQQDHVPASGDEQNLSESEETLRQSVCLSSEAMSTVHSGILMTPEHTSLRDNSVETLQAEYLPQDVFFSMELGFDTEPDNEEENDQELSVMNEANQTKDNSIQSEVTIRPGTETDMNKSDIEESNSSDDDSPNASQSLEPVTNGTSHGEDLLDVALSQKRHSLVDWTAPQQHFTGEVTNDQTTHEDLQKETEEVLESSNKPPESDNPFAGNKTDSERLDINKIICSGVDNDFWGSNLETGGPGQPLKPPDHVTEQSNQNLAMANTLAWGDLEKPQTSSWNTNILDGDTTKASTIEEVKEPKPLEAAQPLCSDMVGGENIASEDEGDSWSSRDE
ncbi:hypothetical protein DPEC_G00353430 [Dallia pectoralis]|uniref:Uncharacterized protein n=1 Tax=Dallia pectoralis TaxID=75939 RepID=A0ACC2F2C4_DALPE|nr:hypothetical protein DPEC_G00353430 [Dallia pectoralis]